MMVYRPVRVRKIIQFHRIASALIYYFISVANIDAHRMQHHYYELVLL